VGVGSLLDHSGKQEEVSSRSSMVTNVDPIDASLDGQANAIEQRSTRSLTIDNQVQRTSWGSLGGNAELSAHC